MPGHPLRIPQGAVVRRGCPVNKDLKILLAHLGRTALFGLMVSLPALLLYCDIHWLKDAVGEWSLVELTQEGFLLASVLAFARLALRRRDDHRFAVLAAGFFACMFIREMDAVLDLLVHGLWKYLVLPISVGCVLYAARDWRSSLSGLVRFMASRPGTVMVIGLVLLLFYSRLIGMTSLWNGLLADHYVRVFKNAVEETTELLGYTFILAASLGYAAQRIREPARFAHPAAVPGPSAQRSL